MEKRKILLKCFQVKRQSSPTYRNQINEQRKSNEKKPIKVLRYQRKLRFHAERNPMACRAEVSYDFVTSSVHIYIVYKKISNAISNFVDDTLSFQEVFEFINMSQSSLWRHYPISDVIIEKIFATATGARGDVLGGRTISHTAGSWVFVHGTKNCSRVLLIL